MIFSIIKFIILSIIMTLTIILLLSIHYWTIELEKNNCECSKLWHREVLKTVSIIILINMFVRIILEYIRNTYNNSKIFKYINYISLFISMLTIPYMGILYDYIIKLKEMQDCKCSEDWKREFAYYYSLIYIIFITTLTLILLIIGTTTYLMFLK